jgi:general nucleoside transport system permease protein
MTATLKSALRVLLVPALAIFSGLVVGALVIIFTDPETLRAWASFFRNPGRAFSVSWDLVSNAYSALLRSSLGSRRALSETLVEATPLMFAGLSVALAFRAGLFNIGGEGQILSGALAATYVGFTFRELPFLVHLPFALVAAMTAGLLWGFIPGFLKARTGAHEVITTIMLNFIALRFVDYMLSTDTFRRPGRADPISRTVAESAQLPSLAPDLRAHWGVFLALAVAWVVWWFLFRSTIGFRFRAVGSNPDAASYAGMSVGGTYVLAMCLAGALAGLAGANQLLGVRKSLTGGFTGYGFTAIALALIGRTHPVGVILAALLFGVLRAGAVGMQAATAIPVDIIVVIQALVIVFVAAPALVREIYRIRAERIAPADAFAKSWAT